MKKSNSNTTKSESQSSKQELSEPTVEYENQKVTDLRKSSETNIDDQIKSTQSEKSKIVTELEESKSSLKELESKLTAINQIYADLKK